MRHMTRRWSPDGKEAQGTTSERALVDLNQHTAAPPRMPQADALFTSTWATAVLAPWRSHVWWGAAWRAVVGAVWVAMTWRRDLPRGGRSAALSSPSMLDTHDR